MYHRGRGIKEVGAGGWGEEDGVFGGIRVGEPMYLDTRRGTNVVG